MRLISYLKEKHPQLAFLANGHIYDADSQHPDLPGTMSVLLNFWEHYYPVAEAVNKSLLAGNNLTKGIPLESVRLLAPVPHPASCRDAYAFRQHVAASRQNRGVEMIAEFDQFPTFYFTNHHSIAGPGVVACMPDHFNRLDFELEVAIVICKPGRNIKAEDADEYIGGYMIMNDLSARTLQMEEMKLNLGPAKGKDFATLLGPELVTPDELEKYKIEPPEGHVGNTFDLTMKCMVNGVQVSAGNLGDMNWTFAEIIERCSYGAQLYPGDIIGSGTVGTGCFLELNGTGKLNNPEYKEQWLKPGDEIIMKVEALGTLKNTIIQEESNFSILARKKNV